MVDYNLTFTGDETQEALQKARDFSGVPLGDGLYSGVKIFTAYNEYLNDSGALFKLNPTAALGYDINLLSYPEAKDDPNLIPYIGYESNAGWDLSLGDFAAGKTLTKTNEVLRYQTGLYRTSEPLPYTTNGATPGLDSGAWLAVEIGELESIARSLNVPDSAVQYTTYTGVLDAVKYLYDETAQVTWRVPELNGIGETIVSVSGSDLVTSGGSYALVTQEKSDLKMTLDESIASASLKLGDTVRITDRDDGLFDVVLASTVTPNTYSIIQMVGAPHLALSLRISMFLTAKELGAKADGSDSLAAIQHGMLVGGRVILNDGSKFSASDTIEVGSFQSLKIGANATIEGAVSPAVRVKGERGSFKGTDFSSVVKLTDGTPSPQGVVKIGQNAITDLELIQYNHVGNFRIVGDDPFGTKAIHTGVDTVGLMCLNLGDWNQNPSSNSLVFFNTVNNILFEDVKQAYVVAGPVAAQISSQLYFRRAGEFGIYCFNPRIADGAGVVYGVDWDDAGRLDSSLSENSYDQMFADGSFQDTTGIFPIMAFLRLEGNVRTQQFTNVMDESGPNTVLTPAEGYHIDASVDDCHIQGDFNIAPAGTNLSTTTSIWNLSGLSLQSELRIRLLYSDRIQVQTSGTAAAPHMYNVGSETTGMYWPAPDEVGFSFGGAEAYRGGGATAHVFTGGWNMKGDGTTKSYFPDVDGVRIIGSGGLRYNTISLVNAPSVTSDETLKTKLLELTSAEMNVAGKIATRQFKYLDAVKQKGDDAARKHFGFGAQSIIAAFESEGLNALEYACVRVVEWSDSFADVLDDSGEVVGQKLVSEKGWRYEVVVDEVLALKCAYYDSKLNS